MIFHWNQTMSARLPIATKDNITPRLWSRKKKKTEKKLNISHWPNISNEKWWFTQKSHSANVWILRPTKQIPLRIDRQNGSNKDKKQSINSSSSRMSRVFIQFSTPNYSKITAIMTGAQNSHRFRCDVCVTCTWAVEALRCSCLKNIKRTWVAK